jgi:predicted dehydrogenase
MVRTFGGSTPEVVSAQAKLRNPQADRAMTAQLQFASGHTGRVRCSLWSSDLLQLSAEVVGDRGQLRVLSPVAPFVGSRYQHDAFAAAVLRGEPVRRRCKTRSRTRPSSMRSIALPVFRSQARPER